MKKELIHSLTDTFEGHAQETEDGVEFWLARDLQHLLGYSEWRNFTQVTSKAKTACEVADHVISDHFVDINKMVELGSGSQREVDDIMLTRYPWYLLTDRCDGQIKETELNRKAPSEVPPTYGNIRQGFVYERVPHITLKSSDSIP